MRMRRTEREENVPLDIFSEGPVCGGGTRKGGWAVAQMLCIHEHR